MITSVSYTLPLPSDAVAVTMQDGTVWTTDASLPPDTGLRRMLHDWLAAGGVISPFALPPPTAATFIAAINAHLDAVVGERGYSSILSAASYDGDPLFGAEGAAAKVWRSAVWAYAYAEMAKVTAGQRPMPTVAELLAELPAIDWPGTAP